MRNIFILLIASCCILIENQVHGFCVIRNRKLHQDVTRAIIKGSSWLQGQQDTEGKWLSYHTTGYALSTLNLIGHDVNTGSKCVDMPFALNYITKLNGSFDTIDGGKLAHIIIGLRSLCINTSHFMGTNLTDVLLKKLTTFPNGAFNHPFQYSLAVIALRLSNGIIPWPFARKLIADSGKLIADGGKFNARQHGGDTMAVISMALSGVKRQSTEKDWLVKQTIGKLLHKLKEAMFSKNSTMNLYTKSLVMQAFAAANRKFKVTHEKCLALYEDLLSQQKQDGSFGNIGAALHALPALAGASFLDIPSVTCQAKDKTTDNKEIVNVQMSVEFEVGNQINPPQQIVNIISGSTAFDVMKATAKLDPCYVFTYKDTSFGPSIQSICKVKVDPANKLYWMFFVNDKMASVGVGSYKPKSNDRLSMKYQKLKW